MPKWRVPDTGTFAWKIKVLRAARAMTQHELAFNLGVDISIICKVESGDLLPTSALEVRIHDVLDWPARADVAFDILAITEPAHE